MNLYSNRNLFGRYINLGSGAEFDRGTNIDICPESAIFDSMPSDSYGFSLNMKSRMCLETDNFFTIRIFNCFGITEKSTRLFKKFLANTSVFEIVNDRYFDFFSIRDLCEVIKYFVEHDPAFKDINAVYLTKYRISEVLHLFCQLNRLESNFVITSKSSNNYTGNGSRLSTLPLKLCGLDQGLKTYNEGLNFILENR